MGRGGEHAGEGGELLRDEAGHVLQRLALHEDEQVEAAAHEEAGAHLRVLRDAVGQPVEAALALGRHAHLDDRLHAGALGPLVIDDGLVGEDDPVVLQLLDARADVLRRGGQLGGQRLRRRQRVFLQQFSRASIGRG